MFSHFDFLTQHKYVTPMLNCNSMMYVASLMYEIKSEKKNIFKEIQFILDLPNSHSRWKKCKIQPAKTAVDYSL